MDPSDLPGLTRQDGNNSNYFCWGSTPQNFRGDYYDAETTDTRRAEPAVSHAVGCGGGFGKDCEARADDGTHYDWLFVASRIRHMLRHPIFDGEATGVTAQRAGNEVSRRCK